MKDYMYKITKISNIINIPKIRYKTNNKTEKIEEEKLLYNEIRDNKIIDNKNLEVIA